MDNKRNVLFSSSVTARVAPAPEATPVQRVAQRAAPGAATVPGAAPGRPAAPRRGGHQEEARPVPDPPPGPSLAPSLVPNPVPNPAPSPTPSLAPAHLLLLRTNSLAPALVPDPARTPAHGLALPQQTASSEVGWAVGCELVWRLACCRFRWRLLVMSVFISEGELITFNVVLWDQILRCSCAHGSFDLCSFYIWMFFHRNFFCFITIYTICSFKLPSYCDNILLGRTIWTSSDTSHGPAFWIHPHPSAFVFWAASGVCSP